MFSKLKNSLTKHPKTREHDKENTTNKLKSKSTAPIQNNEEIALKNLIKVLRIYSDIDDLNLKEKYSTDEPKKKAAMMLKKFLKNFEEFSPLKFSQSKTTNLHVDIHKELRRINKDMLYLLLNVTTEEFHHFFMEFYSLFDQEKDYLISKDDLQFIVNYMGSAENMGKEKLNISIKLILTDDKYSLKGVVDKFSRFFVSDADDVVAPDIFNDLFEQLKDPKTWVYRGQEIEYFIDFLKFLPILMSYFLEYMKRRIEIRRENLMVNKFY